MDLCDPVVCDSNFIFYFRPKNKYFEGLWRTLGDLLLSQLWESLTELCIRNIRKWESTAVKRKVTRCMRIPQFLRDPIDISRSATVFPVLRRTIHRRILLQYLWARIRTVNSFLLSSNGNMAANTCTSPARSTTGSVKSPCIGPATTSPTYTI